MKSSEFGLLHLDICEFFRKLFQIRVKFEYFYLALLAPLACLIIVGAVHIHIVERDLAAKNSPSKMLIDMSPIK